MNASSEFVQAFEQARKLHAEGRLAEAEQAYRQLAAPGEHRAAVLEVLANLYLQTRRPADAIDVLTTLAGEQPDSLYYCARLANVLDGHGRTEAAIGHYLRLLQRQPELATAYFNVALLYKKNQRYADAVAAYEDAVRLGIDRVQEVYSNMGVLHSEMRQADNAREMYERALDIDPEYVPALFNLAGLFEEIGEKQRAVEQYRRVLSIDPQHWDSLARLAHANKVTSAENPLIESLNAAIGQAGDDALAREGLQFALGKVLDDLERYDDAFTAYSAANELGKLRNPPYDPAAVEQAVDQLIRLFDARWLETTQNSSSAKPIFICGMFRSGSTLTEQILGAHSSVRAGGELEFLPWLAMHRLAPYPQRMQGISQSELQQVGDEYLSKLRELFPDEANVSDKRPDNFIHLGLIRALFPSARIIYTKRRPLDNCLSVYFQQLGGNLNYATELQDIAHYYRQHERLMSHWQACFGENIFTLDYDELVVAPEAVLRPLLEFLGLDWDEKCLAFQHADSPVKTASVWQVREALHPRSSGRWRHYRDYLSNLSALLQSDEQQA